MQVEYNVGFDKIGRKIPRRPIRSLVEKREVFYGSIVNPFLYLTKLISDKKKRFPEFEENAIEN